MRKFDHVEVNCLVENSDGTIGRKTQTTPPTMTMKTISQVICCLLIQENVTITCVMWMVCDLQTLELSRYMEISHKTYMHRIRHIEYVSFKIDNWNSKYIKNVLYIPTIINNLVSVKQWMDMWCDPQCPLMSHVIHSTQCKCTTCNVLWNELSWPSSWDPNWWLLSRSIFMHKLWKRNAKSTNSFKLLSSSIIIVLHPIIYNLIKFKLL